MKIVALILALHVAVDGFTSPVTKVGVVRSSVGDSNLLSLNLFELPQIVEAAAVGASFMLTLSKGKSGKKNDSGKVLPSEEFEQNEEPEEDVVAKMFEDTTVLDEFLSDTQQQEENPTINSVNERDQEDIATTSSENNAWRAPKLDFKSNEIDAPPRSEPFHRALLEKRLSYEKRKSRKQAVRPVAPDFEKIATEINAAPTSEPFHRALLEQRLSYEKAEKVKETERVAVPDFGNLTTGSNASPKSEPFHRALLEQRLNYEKRDIIRDTDRLMVEKEAQFKSEAEKPLMAEKSAAQEISTSEKESLQPLKESRERIVSYLDSLTVEENNVSVGLSKNDDELLLEDNDAFEEQLEDLIAAKPTAEMNKIADFERETKNMDPEDTPGEPELHVDGIETKNSVATPDVWNDNPHVENTKDREDFIVESLENGFEDVKIISGNGEKALFNTHEDLDTLEKDKNDFSVSSSETAPEAHQDDPIVDEVRQKIMEQASQRTKSRMQLSEKSKKLPSESGKSTAFGKMSGNSSQPTVSYPRPGDSVKKYNGPDEVVSKTSDSSKGDLVEVDGNDTEGASPMRFLRRKKNHIIVATLAVVLARRLVITIIRANML